MPVAYQLLGRFFGPSRDALSVNTAWNGVTQVAPQLIGLITIPLLLRHLGLGGYGVWALANTVIVFGVSLDGGISSSAQRFYALHLSRHDVSLAARFTASLFALVGAATVVLYAFGPLISRVVLGIAHVPAHLTADAGFLMRNIGILIGLMLCSNILIGYLRASNRFRRIAISTVLAQLSLLVAIVVSANSLTVAKMFTLTLIQLVVLNAMLVPACLSHLLQVRARLLSRAEFKEFFSYAWRAQIMNASSLAILQTDAIFVAALLPIEELGLLAIGAQVASAVRTLPLFALPPLLSQITDAFGKDGLTSATETANRRNRTWLAIVPTYTVIAIATVAFGIRGWAGALLAASTVAVVLTMGNGLNLLTGVATAYVRAIGRPGLEARYAVVLVVGNLALSGPCTYFGGLAGAVWSTFAVQLAGVIYFYRIMARNVPAFDRGLGQLRPVRLLLVAGSAFGLGLFSLLLPPRSLLTLPCAVAAAGIPALVIVLIARKEGAQQFLS